MKRKIYDSIVIGLGAMGSSCIYHLSKSGASVLGIEKFISPHKHGSSHGESRITREAYAEGFHYVKLVQRANELWKELEKDAKTTLFLKYGGLYVGDSKSELFIQTRKCADKFNIPHKILQIEELNKNYKFFNFPENQGLSALYEENAGILLPEKCVSAHLNLAKKHGADIKFNSSIEKIKFDYTNKTIILRDNLNNEYESKNLVLSCGSWLNEVLSKIDVSNNKQMIKLNLPVRIEKNYYVNFKFNNHKHKEEISERFPIYMYQPKGKKLNDVFYGFPDLGQGNHFKVALYHLGKFYDNYDELDRKITNEDRIKLFNNCKEVISEFSKENIQILKEDTCIYTTSPDEDFIMDFYPNNENIVIASPCSGHGFKFSSRVGEYISNLFNKKEKIIQDFTLDRFFKK